MLSPVNACGITEHDLLLGASYSSLANLTSDDFRIINYFLAVCQRVECIFDEVLFEVDGLKFEIRRHQGFRSYDCIKCFFQIVLQHFSSSSLFVLCEIPWTQLPAMAVSVRRAISAEFLTITKSALIRLRLMHCCLP